MTVVVTSYIITAAEGLGPLITSATGSAASSYNIGIAIGLILAVVLFVLFIPLIAIKQKGKITD